MIEIPLHEKEYIEKRFRMLKRSITDLSDYQDQMIRCGMGVDQEKQVRVKTSLTEIIETFSFMEQEVFQTDQIILLSLKMALEEFGYANVIWKDIYPIFVERQIDTSII